MSVLDSFANGTFEEPSSVKVVTVKLYIKHQAIVEATTKLAGSKSEAIRLLIEAGWERIERDGRFEELVAEKDDIERSLYEDEAFLNS